MPKASSKKGAKKQKLNTDVEEINNEIKDSKKESKYVEISVDTVQETVEKTADENQTASTPSTEKIAPGVVYSVSSSNSVEGERVQKNLNDLMEQFLQSSVSSFFALYPAMSNHPSVQHFHIPSNYDASFVNDVYSNELSQGKIQAAASSGYLPNYLWKHFNKTVSLPHLLSIIVLLSEQNLIQNASLHLFSEEEAKFGEFLERCIDWYLDDDFRENLPLKSSFTSILRQFYLSLEVKPVRNTVLRYLSLPIWYSVSKARREQELSKDSNLTAAWKKLQLHRNHLYDSKKALEESASSSSGKKGKRKRQDEELQFALSVFERDSQFFPKLTEKFLKLVQSIQSEGDVNPAVIKFVYIQIELLLDLLLQYPTRRYLKVLLDDRHFIILCKRSFIFSSSSANGLLQRVVNLLEQYLLYPVDDREEKLIPQEVYEEANNDAIIELQRYAFENLRPKLDDLIVSSMGKLSNSTSLRSYVQILNYDEILQLTKDLRIVHEFDTSFDSDSSVASKDFLLDLICERYCARKGLIDQFKGISIYPNEVSLWDEYQIPYVSSSPLVIPKVNLHYLSIEDYLYRHLLLYQSNSFYQIRDDIIDAVKRSAPKKIYNGSILFNGWSQYALPILSMTIDEVAKPTIGEIVPSRVSSTITIDIARFGKEIRDEWEAFKPLDVIFLVSFEEPQLELNSEVLDQLEKDKAILEAGMRLPTSKGSFGEEEVRTFLRLYGIKYIRGAEVSEYRDESNNVIHDPLIKGGNRSGTKRKIKIDFDPVQYYSDMQNGQDCYDKFHLIVRRDPRDNNFKAILETLRNLLITRSVGDSLPAWLEKSVVALGNVHSAHSRSLESNTPEKDNYFDTFLDFDHLKQSFPDVAVSLSAKKIKHAEASSFYRLEILRSVSDNSIEKVTAHPFLPRSRGPYPENAIIRSFVRFSPRQTEAVRAGMRSGLTLIAGPSGSGKTETVVQLISNLYHTYPNQKIVVVAQTNAALDDILGRFALKDIHPRHILRLGGLNEQSTYSKQGRIDWCLARRIQLLGQVQRLAYSVGQVGDMGSTCETASYFYNLMVQPKISQFWEYVVAAKESKQPLNIAAKFPFSSFFNDVVPPLFAGGNEEGHDYEELHLLQVDSCFNYLYQLFEELDDYRAMEYLRTSKLRQENLIVNQARIIAMTSAHAAIAKEQLVEIGFRYDSLIVEEASHLLDIETFIPSALQVPTVSSDGIALPAMDESLRDRLKRVVLVGDNHQPPQALHNQSLSEQRTRFEESFFSRLIRLQYPVTYLDQVYTKPEVASYFSWRYEQPTYKVVVAPVIQATKDFVNGNAGFYYSSQWIDVPLFQNQGEVAVQSSYQNIGEAEYVVATFQYMCLLGYPADRISIVTTYEAQRKLIKQLLYQRCQLDHEGVGNVFSKPRHISTVDNFQGLRNDFVLVSLVRTQSIQSNDLKLALSAFSRARLGLYVFGHLPLFKQHQEWFPLLAQALRCPTKLTLVAGESFPTERVQSKVSHLDDTSDVKSKILEIEDVTTIGILVYQMVQQIQHMKSQ